MRKTLAGVMLFCLFCAIQAKSSNGGVVVLDERGFPSADTASPPADALRRLLPGASFVAVEGLKSALAARGTSLLVLPYGSAFPESAWGDIHGYLARGGNLLVIGGKPFTRAAYKSVSGWQLRDYNVRFLHQLLIDQYQETPGSEGLRFEANPEVVTRLAPFRWKQGFSPIIRLSASRVSNEPGAAGALDGRLDPLTWGTKGGRRISSPAMQIDHVHGPFTGSRWVFLSAELASEFYTDGDASRVIPALVDVGSRGSEEFTARPELPLYTAGETVQVELDWLATRNTTVPLLAEVTVTPEVKPDEKTTKSVSLTDHAALRFPAPATKGLHIIEAKLKDGDRVISIYHSAFWMRDEAYLRSGPRLSVNSDYFELNGRPLAVVGTTYMASDVQRLYFEYPNAFVWDRDLGQISSAGINMLRTGWWMGWEKLCNESGRPYERTLRTLEAYLMTARKHNLPVQVNVLAFYPDAFVGANAYLDPEAVRREKSFYAGVAERFRNVPFLAWDLINEPSNSQTLWKTRANRDPVELTSWNEWLRERYPDRAALAHAWNVPFLGEHDVVPVPIETEFDPKAMYGGHINSLKVRDYHLFSQQRFAEWVSRMRQAIRGVGAQQPITVGQDEGGYSGRVSPAFFTDEIDFTTNHSWWENDDLLWDSLVAKQPGKPMLVQETGLQRELTMDEVARRTAENEGALFERKMALSFVQGSGAIQWLWNSNTYMTSGNEAAIGALRSDGTEKPEAAVMRGFAAFAKIASSSFRNPELPSVAVVTSQAAQFSPLGNMQVEAQRTAVRALGYYNRVSTRVIAENQIEKLGDPKLAILPSAQALDETTWQALLEYVNKGGNLLVTGAVARDPHWHRVDRLQSVDMSGVAEPLTYRTAEIRIGGQTVQMSFDQNKQLWLEAVRFGDSSGIREQSFGKGRIFWAAYPIELAEGVEPTSKLYAYFLQKTGVQPLFEVQRDFSPGVLVYATSLKDAVLYVLASDDANDTTVEIHDKLTGAQLKVPLAGQHAAVALIDKRNGSLIAKYGF